MGVLAGDLPTCFDDDHQVLPVLRRIWESHPAIRGLAILMKPEGPGHANFHHERLPELA